MQNGRAMLVVVTWSAAMVPCGRVGAAAGPVWDVSPGQPGMDARINALHVAGASSPTGAALIAGGAFTSAGGARIGGAARWDGNTWQPIGDGPPSGEVLSVVTFQDELVVSGFVGLPGLARWDGRDWTIVGDGPTSWIGGLGVLDTGGGSELFVSGGFVFPASDGWAEYVVRWDGTTWFMAGELASVVNQMIVWDDGGGPKLYGAGTMGIALEEGGFCIGVGRWEGSSWSRLGTCLNGTGNALAVYDDGTAEAVYVGGGFFGAGAGTAANIAAWDGSSWSSLDGGVNGQVHALAVFDDGSGPKLYAGGAFNEAGGVPAQHIARWDGSSWSAVGEGADDAVYALTAFGEEAGGPALAVAGDFTMIGGQPANRVAFLRPAVPGDVDGDGLVNVSDLLLLLAGWGDCPDPPAGCPADLDGDSEVGVVDLLIVLGNWS